MTVNLQAFNKLVEDQFRYGGKKYAHTGTKESTDVLFDKHGYRWLVGTVDKYTFRFSNLERERDLLKIACYMYIMWLKRGFHLKSEGLDEKIIDTTVDVKAQYFTDYIVTIGKYYDEHSASVDVVTKDEGLRKISSILAKFSNTDWFEISEEDLAGIYCYCFSVWNVMYYVTGLAGKDTDTFNEDKKFKEKFANVLAKYFQEKQRIPINDMEDEDSESVPMLVYTVDDEDISILSQELANIVNGKGVESGNKN